MTIVYAVILLGILIFVHELGHFLVAKLSGVKVLKFSLGFGPKVIGKKIGGTEYILSAFPLGGYVKMLGEEPGDEFDESERDRAFSFQPLYRRASIVFAGPLFNMLFASVLLSIVFMIGVPRLIPKIGEVMKDSPALSSGIKTGDMILAIDESDIKYWDEMADIIHQSPGKSIILKIKRDAEIIGIKVVPEEKPLKNIFGEETEVGLIGVKPKGDIQKISFGLFESINLGIKRTWDISALTVTAIIKLIQRVIPADTIGGPVMIFQLAGKQAEAGMTNFFTFMALISINLAILNLLPIPILDGGHIFFMAIEAVRGRPLSEKFLLVSQKIGLALIISLMAFALYNDFLRIFLGKPLP